MTTLNTNDFDFHLPEELIAQTPLEKRDASKLLMVNRQTGEFQDRHFHSIIEMLEPGDALVMNDTRVLPARLHGQKEETGGHVELLLLKNTAGDEWEVLAKPAKRLKVGTRVIFGDGRLSAVVTEELTHGGRIVRFEYEGIFLEVLESLGEMPLPPYIHEKLDDRERYQTVYAKYDGSAAAPTAGLHFTPELLQQVRDMGVEIAEVTLHVGLGTFRPVKETDVLKHHMHSEFYKIEQSEADKINKAKKEGHRVIAVGTTSTRTLESAADENGFLTEKSGWTEIFIYPGYQFKVIDALITNFHLPESTLVMLVSALAGREHVLAAYETAVEEKYRFFSFGDAMFIVDRES